MKVKTLMEQISQLDPDDDICVLYYTKDLFDYEMEDEYILTQEVWQKIVKQFDGEEFATVGEWIADGVIEYAERCP